MGCGAVGINQPGPENGSVDTASARSSSTDDASRTGNFHRSRSLTSVFTVAEDVDNLSLPQDATLESFQALIAGTNIGAVFNIEHFKGDGAFASVYGGTGAGGKPCAVKAIDKRKLEASDVRYLLSEVEATQRCAHRNVIEVLDYEETEDAFVICLVCGAASGDYYRRQRHVCRRGAMVARCLIGWRS